VRTIWTKTSFYLSEDKRRIFASPFRIKIFTPFTVGLVSYSRRDFLKPKIGDPLAIGSLEVYFRTAGKPRRPGWQRLEKKIDPRKMREKTRELLYKQRPDLRNRTREERLENYQRMLERIADNPPFESLEQLMREVRGNDWETG